MLLDVTIHKLGTTRNFEAVFDKLVQNLYFCDRSFVE